MTFPGFTRLPSDLQREVYQKMDGQSLNQMSGADTAARRNVKDLYTRANADQAMVVKAYQVSQGSQAQDSQTSPRAGATSSQPMETRADSGRFKRTLSNVESSQHPARDKRVQESVRVRTNLFGSKPLPPFCLAHQQSYLLKRGDSLTRKTRELFGGPRVLDQATEDSTISHLHPDAQGRMADARWNCKAIGLYPFVKAVPGGEDFLAGLDPDLPDGIKVADMEEWLRNHAEAAAHVQEVSITGFTSWNMGGIRSQFYDLGGKVYNLVPKSIYRFFTGLRTLTLCNNMLKSLPASFGRLSVRSLNLSMNPFAAVPEAIAQMKRLKELSFSMNRGELALGDDSPLWRAYPLEELDLSRNDLEQLSRGIRKLVNLRKLVLSDNQLSYLTGSMTRLKRLEILDLSANNFVSLPLVLAEMPALQELHLQGNPLMNPAEVINFLRNSAVKERMEITLQHGFLTGEAVAFLREEFRDTHDVILFQGMVDKVVMERKDRRTPVIDFEAEDAL